MSRNQVGLQLVAAYHRLGSDCEEISQIHEIMSCSKFFYLIMPPAHGNVHSYLIEKKKIPESEASNIFKQMLTAVQYCHSKGIIVRDFMMWNFVFHDKER